MNKRRLLLWVLCLSILMLFCIVPAKAEETEPEAEEITRNYTFAKNNSEINALYTHDGKLVTYNTYGPEDVLHIRPKGDWTMHILFFRFQTQTARMTLQQFDRQGTLLLTLDVDSDSLCCAVTLEEGCCSVDITAREESFGVCELTILGPGRLPDSFPQPEASVTRTDLLIVTTHPDDEWIFLGAVYPIYVAPIYVAEQGYTGTFAYVTTPSMGRVHEAINSVWSAGMHTLPYFLGFADIYSANEKAAKEGRFKQQDVTLALVRLYRRIKPLVVVTQDLKGEYGHDQAPGGGDPGSEGGIRPLAARGIGQRRPGGGHPGPGSGIRSGFRGRIRHLDREEGLSSSGPGRPDHAGALRAPDSL